MLKSAVQYKTFLYTIYLLWTYGGKWNKIKAIVVLKLKIFGVKQCWHKHWRKTAESNKIFY